MATMSSQIKRLYEFGSYRLDSQKRLLTRGSESVSLTPKAIEALIVLVENRDRVVSKDELMRLLWPDSFVEESNLSQNIFVLRRALGDSAQERRYILTVPGRGYQFTETVREVGEIESEEALVVETHSLSRVLVEHSVSSSRRLWGGLAILVILLAAGLYVRRVRANKLRPDDTIVLGDFANSTGDPIFDDTLKQGLTLTLRQSPFLNILPQSKISRTLRLMTRDPETALTAVVANEVCQRAGSKVYVAGAIGSLGSEYVLGLKAINCRTGDVLAQEQITAARKEQVLTALSDAATRLRTELGESLTTVQKFDVPLTEATTASLEALRQYSLGLRAWNTKGDREAIPYLNRAIELDPKFASAYVSLGTVYRNLELPVQAAENMTKAYELRDRVSERERFYIQAHYYHDVTEELEKAIPTYQQWMEAYPSEPTPRTNLGNIYTEMGRTEDSLPQHLQALQLEPNGVLIHENLAMIYSYLNRLDDADAMVQRAFDRKLDDVTLHLLQVQLAQVRGDSATAEKKLEWGIGKPGVEDSFLAMRSDIEVAAGRLKKARESTELAVESARKAGSNDTAAYWRGYGAMHEADLGNAQEAVKQADAALSLSRNQDTLILVGLALARAGKAERAKAIADQLDHDWPHGTLTQFYWVPAIRATIDLNGGNGAAAMRTLQRSSSYEMCNTPPWQALGPIYLRGEALLQLHQGADAAVEFKKVLAHRPMIEFWENSLANLQLGRAYAMSGDMPNAKKSYQDFFTLWNNADSDIPVLKTAKMEYAKLK